MAKLFEIITGVIGALSQPRVSLYNIKLSNVVIITFPGGVHIKNATGKIIDEDRRKRKFVGK